MGAQHKTVIYVKSVKVMTRESGGTYLATSICDHSTLVGVLKLLNRIDVLDIAFGTAHPCGHTVLSQVNKHHYIGSGTLNRIPGIGLNLLPVCECVAENLHPRACVLPRLRAGFVEACYRPRRGIEFIVFEF